MTIRLKGFSGEVPRVEPFYLPDQAAVAIMDAAMRGGSLTPFRQATAEEHLFGSNCVGFYLHGAEWLGWDHATDVAPGPVATDRLYITHSNAAPTFRVEGVERPLNLPNPTTKPVLTLNGTLNNDLSEAVVYAYTWVTSLGEESGPSPISNQLLWSPNCNVEISGMPITVPVVDRLITKKRIYRGQTSSTGVTDLYFVAEVNATVHTYVHDLDDDPINEVIGTKNFDPVPSNLRGLTAMPNGIMAGFRGKELCFSEPYQPHAWPGAYALTLTDTIIGLAAFGTTLAVLTTGQPYIVQGMHPDQMAMQKMEQPFPCLSKQSIVDMGYSAIYASTDGLVSVSESGAQLMTKGLWTREQWLAMQPTTMRAGRFGQYYGFTYTPAGGETKHTVLVDPTGETPAVLRASEQPTEIYTHIESGKTYFLAANRRTVRAWDDPSQARKSYSWQSKPWRLDVPQSFGAIRIETNPAVGDTLSVEVYADGDLIRTVTTPNSDQRLPVKTAHTWQIRISGTAAVISVSMARTLGELSA